MKVILVGLGGFGYGWYRRLKKDYKHFDIVVVDTDPKTKDKLKGDDNSFYTSLIEAIEKENPDFIINVTPPHLHRSINDIAFDYKLPVLCEKPISDNYQDAEQTVKRALDENIPFMIAENYRFFPFIRKLKMIIDRGDIGDIEFINIQFLKHLYPDKQYILTMNNPLLVDVTIHHFDLIRYLTGREGRKIYAKNYNPKNSLFNGNANVYALIEMEDDIMVSYTGSLAAREMETSWAGNWRIQGSKGVLILENDKIRLIKDGKSKFIDVPDNVKQRGGCLDEFIVSLREKRPGETCGNSYIKTQILVHFAELSSNRGKVMRIE